MNATVIFLPKASSPFSVDGPSASTWPTWTLSPTFTSGLWFKLVEAFVLSKFAKWYVSLALAVLTTIFKPSTYSTTPSALQTTVEPESLAAIHSTPVPTIGASGTNKGTAWRCMFDPIKVRLASSNSKNGIQLVVIDTTWLGATSI